jgi:small GTP-binding protein
MSDLPARCPVNVVIIGDAGVGKTCLLKRLTSDTFNTTEEFTMGVANEAWVAETPDGSPIAFDIWDTAGHEMFHALVPLYTRDSRIGILCYAVDDGNSFDHLDAWNSELRETSPSVRVLVAGTKADLKGDNPAVSIADAQEKADALHGELLETSAKAGTGIADLKRLLVEMGNRLEAPERGPTAGNGHAAWARCC